MKTCLKWLPAVAAFCLFSCKNEAPKPASPTAESPKTEAEKPVFEKPEAETHVVILDKFRLRETADPAGKELLQMPKGSIFEATGRLSDVKFDLKINGMEQGQMHFYEGTSGGKTGWAYAAGLLKVHSGKKANAPDATFSTLAAAIGKLAAGKLESGSAAIDLVQKSTTKSGDAAFLLLENTIRNLGFSPKVMAIFDNPKLNAALEKEGDAVWKNTFDHSKFPETKAVKAAGLRVETTEGSYFPVVDYKNLQKIFAGKLSPAMSRYLDLTTIDNEEMAISDGGMVIELTEYAERAVNWINFRAENPNFVLNEEVRNAEYWLISGLLFGQNNTPAFDYETKKIHPETKAAWDIILKKVPNSEAAKTIKTFSDLVAAEGGKRTEKVEAWIENFLKTMPN